MAMCVLAAACTDSPPPLESESTSAREQVLAPQNDSPSDAAIRETQNENIEETVMTRAAQSHVHGGAALSVISEQNRVMIEFESPIYNITGFEYSPETDAEKQVVMSAQNILSNPQTLMRFNADAECRFAPFTADIALFKDNHDDHDDDHDHHDSHDEEVAEETHDGHNDIILTYNMTCKSPEKLKTLTVGFFDKFPNLTDLELVYLGPSVQRSFELSNTTTRIDIAP